MSAPDIPAEIAERAEILVDQFRHIEDDREFVARILMEVGQGHPAPSRLGLTEIQQRGLDLIADYQRDRGFSPSYAEIGAGLGFHSKGAVHAIIHQLIDRGAITMAARRGRSIAIVRHSGNVSSAHKNSVEA